MPNSLNQYKTKVQWSACSDHPATIDKLTPCNLPFIVTMYVKSSLHIFSIDLLLSLFAILVPVALANILAAVPSLQTHSLITPAPKPSVNST